MPCQKSFETGERKCWDSHPGLGEGGDGRPQVERTTEFNPGGIWAAFMDGPKAAQAQAWFGIAVALVFLLFALRYMRHVFGKPRREAEPWGGDDQHGEWR